MQRKKGEGVKSFKFIEEGENTLKGLPLLVYSCFMKIGRGTVHLVVGVAPSDATCSVLVVVLQRRFASLPLPLIIILEVLVE